ncbi:5-oxoprolinase subunit PxpA [Hoeflea sp. TYP-13]|uniref:5-oxoprolinase subunit PxpA n=1 Tax=Hoeflea sp. TYP-13 TaxID=3230023 RepID=UPI0034C64F56
MSVDINCDMGESFGLYRLGDDEAIIPHITQANVACGFHGSDPNHMRQSIELARRHGVKVGAHFSLPDLAGFGRREMKIEREEMVNIIIYQIGALKGFLDVSGIALNHLKPHGALYGMAASQEPIAHAVADAAEHFKVPVLGLAGTLHEEIYTARGLEFHAEFFSDLDYDDQGKLLITRKHEAVDPQLAAQKSVRAVSEGLVRSVGGTDVPVRAQTICVHSDTPNAADVARSIRVALEPYLAA